VIAGVYPLKEDRLKFPATPLGAGDSGRRLTADADGLLEAVTVPTGFLRIRRRALEALAAEAKHLVFADGEALVPIIFERVMREDRRVGGDTAFCYKWRNLGGRIFVYPQAHFEHVGLKHWRGCLLEQLKKEAGAEAPAAAAAQ